MHLQMFSELKGKALERRSYAVGKDETWGILPVPWGKGVLLYYAVVSGAGFCTLF